MAIYCENANSVQKAREQYCADEKGYKQKRGTEQ